MNHSESLQDLLEDQNFNESIDEIHQQELMNATKIIREANYENEELSTQNYNQPPPFYSDIGQEEYEKHEEEEEEEKQQQQQQQTPLSIDIIGLESKGYLFLRGIFSREVIDRTCFEVNQFMQMEGIYSHLQKRQDVPLQRYYINNTYGTLTNFQQIQHYFVPVIDNRGTYNRMTDVGVVDIYNADRLFPQIRNYFDLNLMNMLLMKTTGIEWKLTRVNLQIHSNVQNPMSFHFDGGNEKNIKFMIYLCDIKDDLSGPPVFMDSTHRNKKNIKPSQSKIFHGEKGDVLISYQNGFHRKLSQKVQGTNMFLTFHFTTKSERDRYFPLSL